MATGEGPDLVLQVPASRRGGESRLHPEKRSPSRAYWPFKGLRPARPQSTLIGPESGRAQPNLTHPPAAFPIHLPRGPVVAPANRRPARQPSSAWSRPRERPHPIRHFAEAVLACRGRGERQGRARGGWLERRSSGEVRESFFGGENSRGTRGPAKGWGRGGPGAGEGPLPDRGRVGPALPGGDRPTKDPWGARPRGPPRPWIRPPQTPRARHSGAPPPGHPVGGSGAPHSATRLPSRWGRERPCPTAPSSPARPPRECDIPSPSPLGATAQPPPALSELLAPRPPRVLTPHTAGAGPSPAASSPATPRPSSSQGSLSAPLVLLPRPADNDPRRPLLPGLRPPPCQLRGRGWR